MTPSLFTTTSPGKTSRPQCRSGDELGSVRKPIDLRPGLTATVLTSGKATRIRCIQSLFMPICVISARKLPIAVGNSSQSADQITAWHANGSLKLKTLLHGTSVLPRDRNYLAGQLVLQRGASGGLSFGWQKQSDRRDPKSQLYFSSTITSNQCTDYDANVDIAPQRWLNAFIGMPVLRNASAC